LLSSPGIGKAVAQVQPGAMLPFSEFQISVTRNFGLLYIYGNNPI